MDFKRGDDVEIFSNEEGFEGSYYQAIIVSKVSDNDYIVQYSTLLKDDFSGPLRAFISGDYIRPVPDDVMLEDGLNVKMKVDVYFNEGWWVGQITKKIGVDKFHVCFEHKKEDGAVEEGDFSFSQIRFHQDWVNGEWV